MAKYSIYGKRKLCYTNLTDYTDYQGIGHDPLYKRYDSVMAVVRQHIPAEYHHFLAQPLYSVEEDTIEWYIENWQTDPVRMNQLSGPEKEHYDKILEQTLQVYRSCLDHLEGEDRFILSGALKYIDNAVIYCYADKVALVAWGMRPDTKKHIVKGAVIHDFVIEKQFTVSFDAGIHGVLANALSAHIKRKEGFIINRHDLPTVVPNEGFLFDRWEPQPIDHKVMDDVCFHAIYKPEPKPEVVEPAQVITAIEPEHEDTPTPEATDQYEEPDTATEYATNSYESATEETICEQPIPWYRRLWNWLRSEKVMKWIKRILLLLLIILLLVVISRSCTSCERETNEVVPVNTITTPDGKVIDDNRPAHRIGGDNGKGSDKGSDQGSNQGNGGDKNQGGDKGNGSGSSGNGGSGGSQPGQGGSGGGKRPGSQDGITDNKGQLPKDKSLIVAPIMGDDGTPPPVHKQPGKPDIIANRLNLYFEDDDADLQAFASEFKSIYADEKYQIIGCDDKVKFIQIQIPEEEREQIRQALPQQFTDFSFFIVDESLFMGAQHNAQRSSSAGWHLNAIHAHQAWQITQGDASVVVAVVDDGIDHAHPIFGNRFVRPYNVFTQNNSLSLGSGHGTHVAGLAAGSTRYLEHGVAGMAPGCSLMPIQVFDNEFCTFSSVTSGIMYAIHQGADVVNISIGPSLQGISQLPVDKQRQIAESLFKNEEKVWQKIISVANHRNCILVFAVGNDKILASIPPENRIGKSVNVAAVDKRLLPAQFSNYGDGANISAPGIDICSSFPTSTFKSMDGTSMAAPIVTGTVALMKSLNPDITVEEVIRVLQHTGEPTHRILPPMIRADRALQLVKSGDYDVGEGDGQDESEGVGDGPDYERIRAMIAEYEKKIRELKELLPDNK